MKRLTGFSLICLTAFLPCFVGCSSSSDGMKTVSGKIEYQGEPVPFGTLTFVPQDPLHFSRGATIKDGFYETRLEPIAYVVQVEGQKESSTDFIPDSSGTKKIPRIVTFTPDELRTKSNISITVGQSNRQTHDIIVSE